MEKGYSIYEAFLALDEMEDEMDGFPTSTDNSRVIQEGKGFDLRNDADVDKASEFREKNKASQEVQLEVIDADADSLENMKSPEEYIGQMLLQCNTCKATTFVKFDDLEKSETDEDVYNMDMECPHCHGKGAGYLLIGQVGKSEEEPEVDNDEKTDDDVSFDNDLDTEDQEGTDVIHNDDTKDEEGDVSSFQWEDGGEEPIDDTDTSEDDTEDTEDESKEDKDVNDTKPDDTEDEDDEEEDKKKKKKNESLNEAEEDSDVLEKDFKYFGIDEIKNEMNELIPEKMYNKIVDNKLVNDFGDVIIPAGTKIKKVKEDEEYTYYNFPEFDITLPVDKLYANQPIIGSKGEIKEDVTNEDVDLTDWNGSVDAFIHHFITENDHLRVNFYTEDGSKIASFDGDDEDAKEIPFSILSATVVKFSFDASQIDIELTDSEQEYTVETLFNMYNIDPDSSEITFDLYEDEESLDEVVGVERLVSKYGFKYVVLPFSVNGLNLYIEGENVEPEPDNELGEVNKLEEQLINTIIGANKLFRRNIDRPDTRENFIAESIRNKEDLDLVYRNFVQTLPNIVIEDFKNVTGYKDELDEMLEQYGYTRNNIQPYSADPVDTTVVTPEVKTIKEDLKDGEGLYESVKSRAELENTLKFLQENNINYRVRKSIKEGYRFDVITMGTKLVENNLLSKIKDADPKFSKEVTDEELENTDTTSENTSEDLVFDEEKFDEKVNEFLSEAYRDSSETLFYRSVKGSINDDQEIIIEGVIDTLDSSKPITWTLTPNKTLDESLNKEVITSYTVTNNISEEVFNY